jgi:hypothetical protein
MGEPIALGGETPPQKYAKVGDVIFLHYLDHDTISLFELERLYTSTELQTHFDVLTRVALMLCGSHTLIPAAACFENPYGFQLLQRYASFCEFGLLRVSGNAFEVYEFQQKKAEYYSGQRSRFPQYFVQNRRRLGAINLAWQSKAKSSTHDVVEAWKSTIDGGAELWKIRFNERGVDYTTELERELLDLPGKLMHTLFNVSTILDVSNNPGVVLLKREINAFITLEWMRSNAALLGATFLTDVVLFDAAVTIPPNSATLSVARMLRILHYLGIRHALIQCPPSTLLEIIFRPEWAFFRDDLRSRVAGRSDLWNARESNGLKKLVRSTVVDERKGALIDSIARRTSEYLAVIGSVGHVTDLGQEDPIPNAEQEVHAVLARVGGQGATPETPPVAVPRVLKSVELRNFLLQLSTLQPQPRGYAFERFLKHLFDAHGLGGRAAFRLRGEQIDGSFDVAGETYLLEAKWQSSPIGAADLRSFNAKVEDKAAWSRGLFLSISGFSEDGLAAFGRGKRIVCMDGLDLDDMLDRELPFTDVMARKVRHVAETGQPFVRVRELF